MQLWNAALLEESVVQAYQRLLLIARDTPQFNGSEEGVLAFYSLLPTRAVGGSWSTLVDSLLQGLVNQPIIHGLTAGTFIHPRAALFPPCALLENPREKETLTTLMECLARLNKPVASCPAAVIAMFLRFNPASIVEVTPHNLRTTLHTLRCPSSTLPAPLVPDT